MKPNGISLALRDKAVVFTMLKASRTEDAIWRAVQEAMAEGWTIKQFRSECADAWDGELEQARRDAAKEWAKP